MTPFTSFALNKKTLAGIADMGFESPTAIQERVIPVALEARDIIGCAQTGTGKTAAYLIPIIEGLSEMHRAKRFHPRALVLLPTRELAQQVAEHFRALAKHTQLRCVCVYGGMEIGAQDQEFGKAGVDLLVATPGRLLEHLSRGALKFREIEYFVLDEADRLLDEGFLPDLRRIVDALPERRQTMLFSATMPPEMEKLSRAILNQPERIQVGLVAPRDQVVEYFCPVMEHQKTPLVRGILARDQNLGKVIVFVRTRAKAKELAPLLGEATALPTGELHSDLTQAERNRTLLAFREGEIRLLVATDVAARGLDIDAISHVVNYDVPNTPDDYIHRVGRTARLDRPGTAITLVSPYELALSLSIEESVRRPIKTFRLEGFPYEFPPEEEEPKEVRPAEVSATARNFNQRKPVAGKKPNPFTKTGQLRPEFQDPEDAPPRRNEKKRELKKILNKRLPHQRRHK